ncbi:hypothetical protein [Actinomadura yumaensis]|uniref:Uncharacterized protein n=1 Tax=Actinomadura yumaensis TaxID=111807 RepID=A0ABW2CP20_9ACTN
MTTNSITVTLAHPLSKSYAAEVHAASVRDYQPGEDITLPPLQAVRLVNAGLVKDVDPRDDEAVRDLFQQSSAPAAEAEEAPAVVKRKST